MRLTEAEALQRWCPMRPRELHEGVITPFKSVMYCIGSECMAWRRSSNAAYGAEATGFCGLAYSVRLP